MDELNINSVSLNRSSDLSILYLNVALATASIAFLLDDWAHRRFVYSRFMPSDVDFIDIGPDVEPEVAARKLRQHWKLGVEPISDMVELLEAKGARVFSITNESLCLHTFSGWRNEVPYIFCSNLDSAVNFRFTLAEQLGHLVLHRHTRPKHYKNVLHAVRAFASAFLMPESGMKSYEKPRYLYLDETYEFVQHWRVTGTVLIARLLKLRKITRSTYSLLLNQIKNTDQQYGCGELVPVRMQTETSLLWDEILQRLKKNGTPLWQVSNQVLVQEEEIVKLLLVDSLSK
ncbi:MAG: ImmA/IrrE family metallo-endopeptidase [Gammaproteobacteria bacterium]|nr:ImmA/IrrE family metallo-endopeptidase [Gammaproteobacteria bacterium]